MRAVYPILQRYVVANRTNTQITWKMFDMDQKWIFQKFIDQYLRFHVKKIVKKLMLWACKSSFRKDIRLVGGGGLSAIIRLENKLPPAATSHPMNLLTACRCP
ncbi:hypothetical protein T02_755 [Trichinella nativa]|uniref:Uncharacterized protein n=1 Tax=Trichinella nativa TaxID=6335 RepID=A0A0V1LJ51_9BILA|nr:hypothetical protein T02_755 [Trichinella nativa]